MDLKERQQRLTEIFHGAPIAKAFGMRLEYNDQDQAVFHLPYNPTFDHALKGIHGGVIATLIDNAGWFTAAPYFKNWIATVEFSTRLLEPVAGVELISTGKIVRLGKRLVTTDMEVKTAAGKLIAKGAGTFTVTGVSLNF